MAGKFRMIRGEVYFPIIVGLHLVFWTIDLSLYEGPIALSAGESPIRRVLGEIMSSWVITVFGFNLLMATRARWVERIFGGLDKMYLIHRRSGIIAMVLLFLHFGIVPRHPEFAIGKPLGFIAMLFIFIGIALSVAPVFRRRILYNKWLSMHRLMGPFYILGVCHAYLVPTLISKLPIVRTYVFGMSVLGILSWFYRVFGHKKTHPKKSYKVKHIRNFGASLVELELTPEAEGLQFTSGQFAFFNFPRINPREYHPFTIASPAGESDLKVVIKSSGDFTSAVQSDVCINDVVNVEGPYGHFTQQHGVAKQQIWIAGGIGITPFLAMARDLEQSEQSVALYWTVRSKDEAIYHQELSDLAKKTSNFSYCLWVSNIKGRLGVSDICAIKKEDKPHVYICGPEGLRDSLTDQFNSMGVPGKNIHSEEFSFR